MTQPLAETAPPTPTTAGPAPQPGLPQFQPPPATPAPLTVVTATGTIPANQSTYTVNIPTQQPAPGAAPAVNEHGFPANTPLEQMPVEQREAYWKHYARRNEQRVKEMADYDQLKSTAEQYQALVAASQTEHEKALTEARRQGETQAIANVGSQLVEAHMRVAAAGRLDEQRVNTLIDGTDLKKFINDKGVVDTDRVRTYVHGVSPQPVAQPPVTGAVDGSQGAAQPANQSAAQPANPPRDFGQGHQAQARPNGLEAGRELARARFAKPQTTPVRQP